MMYNGSSLQKKYFFLCGSKTKPKTRNDLKEKKNLKRNCENKKYFKLIKRLNKKLWKKQKII